MELDDEAKCEFLRADLERVRSSYYEQDDEDRSALFTIGGIVHDGVTAAH